MDDTNEYDGLGFFILTDAERRLIALGLDQIARIQDEAGDSDEELTATIRLKSQILGHLEEVRL